MNRIVKTANFRLAMLYAAVFGASVFLLGLIMFYVITSSLEEHIRDRVESETAQLMGDYNEDGLDELRHDIRERIRNQQNRLYYFIKSPEGKIIFDDIYDLPASGWHYIQTPQGKNLLLHVTPLNDGYVFGVAGDLSPIAEVKQTIRQSVIIAFISAFLFGIFGGIIVSQRFLARVDRFARTAERIGQGQLGARIKLSGSNDDFDQLGAVINQMLNRIEDLVGNIKNVSTNIAHDLRTPLGHIRQKLEALKNSSAHSPEKIEEIISSLDDVMNIFSSLLRISEIESGARRAAFAEVNISNILNKIIETYNAIAEDAGKKFSADISPNIVIDGDKDLLTQMFVNLIENAINHTPQNSVIAISASENEVIISDNGPGIPVEEIEKVTRPFYRLDTSRNTKGNGLGLSMVQAIAQLHDVELSFEDNKPGLRVVVRF